MQFETQSFREITMKTEFETLSAAHKKLATELSALDDRSDALGNQRSELVTRIKDLKQQRVEKTLAGDSFADSGEIAKLTSDVEVIDDALDALVQRREELQPKLAVVAKARNEAEIEAHLRAKAAEMLAQVEVYESGTDITTTAARNIDRLAAEMATIAGGLGPRNGFDPQHIRARLAGRLARAFSALPGGSSGRYGPISWTPEPARASEDWVAEERQALESQIAGIMSTTRQARQPTGEEALRALIDEDRKKPKGPAGLAA
jgi:hypothetical protein